MGAGQFRKLSRVKPSPLRAPGGESHMYSMYSRHISHTYSMYSRHMYSMYSRHIYIFAPYTPARRRRCTCVAQTAAERHAEVCVGCQKILCVLLPCVTRVFSHPTHLLRAGVGAVSRRAAVERHTAAGEDWHTSLRAQPCAHQHSVHTPHKQSVRRGGGGRERGGEARGGSDHLTTASADAGDFPRATSWRFDDCARPCRYTNV